MKRYKKFLKVIIFGMANIHIRFIFKISFILKFVNELYVEKTMWIS